MGALVGAALGFGASTLLGAGPLQNQINYSLNSLFPNQILSPNDIVDLYRRQRISKALYYEIMRYQGFDDKNARLFFRAQDSLLTAEQCFTHRLDRDLASTYDYESGRLTLSQFNQARQNIVQEYGRRMFAQGYTNTEADAFFFSNRPLPTFSTFLEWMAKEVFEPSAIATFRYDQEEPVQLAHYFAKYGVPPEEASKYWIAHWNPIGYGQWRELYQRLRVGRDDIDENTIRSVGIDPANVRISQDDFNEFFKVLELSPYFRDRMIATAFNVLPFTVLQQLYQYGLLNDAQILGKLKDYGYSDTDAALVADTWKRKFPFKGRETLANNILLQQRKGLLTTAQSRAALVAQGVEASVAAYQSNLVEDKINEQRIDWRNSNLAIQLGRGKITDAQMSTMVDSYISDTERRDFTKENIRIQSEKYFKRITPRQITRGVSEGTISIQQARDALTSLRMPQSDIDLLVAMEMGGAGGASGGDDDDE